VALASGPHSLHLPAGTGADGFVELDRRLGGRIPDSCAQPAKL